MYYIIIVIFTIIQTVAANHLMGLPVFEMSPFTIRLWSNYAVAALVLWSPMLWTKNRRWTYGVAILMNLWMVGNLIYYRSYGDVLNRWCLMNISNMQGIWDSILPFMRSVDLLFPAITAVWIILSETVRVNMPVLRHRFLIVLATLLMLCMPQTLIHRKAELPLTPFAAYYADLSMGRMWYVHTFGAVTHLANETIQLIAHRESPAEPVTEDAIAPFLNRPDSTAEQGNLLVIFFESLEDRIIGLQAEGQEITPNINRLVAHPHTAHYAMRAQVREGKSSDAQLILFNGLLPITNGAASMRYAANSYPSLVKYSKAATKRLYAAYPGYMWNQQMNASAYGFDAVYAESVSDCRLADSVRYAIEKAPRPFILTAVTMASHAPFTAYADSSSLQIGESPLSDVPVRYLQCVHYTDSAIGGLISAILTDSVLASTTRILITGDHPVFDLDAPVPFILYDPYCAPEVANHPVCQMDVYTTLIERMHIATPWRGLGKNIADSCGYTVEQVRALEALSERLIRSDYFFRYK